MFLESKGRSAVHSILQKIIDRKIEEIAIGKSETPLSEIKAAVSDAPSVRDFVAALTRSPDLALIAEVKKASPSKGLIREDFEPVTIAKAYQTGGASCISVLTDEDFFQGHLSYLTAVRNAVQLPVLRKDFIVDPWQVWQARAAGADAVLLIAECLGADMLRELHGLIRELGMTPLVELYERANIEKVLACDPVLVGVNNRDLNTFEVDLGHSVAVQQELPAGIAFVSESGISSRQEMEFLQSKGVDAVLVGESLMRQQDIVKATKELLGV